MILPMCLDVLVEVIATHESLHTFIAYKSLLPCMSAKVTLQFVRASESLSTEQPRTEKWSFSCMPA